MATNIWKELPEQSGGGSSGVDSLNGLTGPLAITSSTLNVNASGSTIAIDATGASNTFAGFDGSGNLYSIPGFIIDTTSGGIDESLTEHPDDNLGITANTFNVFFEPLQNSPDETWNIQSIQAFMDNNNSGFTQGTNGTALNLLNLNITHSGTGDTGTLNFISSNSSIGNGTDPITIKGMGFIFGFTNINANVTIDGQLQGYGFQPNINAASIGTGNFGATAFYDNPAIAIPINGYTTFNSNPVLSAITNNHNYNGINITPNITTLSGNANLYGYGFYPTVSTVGNTGQIVGLNMNATITTLGTNANYQGITIGGTVTTMGSSSTVTGYSWSPAITTSHGNINGLSINPAITAGDANFVGINITPSGGATLTNVTGLQVNLSQVNSLDAQGAIGITSDSRLQINASTQLKSAQNFQIGSRVEHLFTVPIGSPVTGTDELAVNVAGDFMVQDNVANGPIGLGFGSVGFIASMAVAATKTVDTITVFLPAAALPDPGFSTGGNVTDFHMIRTFAPLAQGGTLNITNLYGFKLDSTFGTFSGAATNAYGIYLDDNGIKNRFYGSAQYTTNSKTSSYVIDSGAVKDYGVLANSTGGAFAVTLPLPTSGRYLVIKDSGGMALANNITINPHAAETIDGAASLILNLNYQSATLVSDGTNWFVL